MIGEVSIPGGPSIPRQYPGICIPASGGDKFESRKPLGYGYRSTVPCYRSGLAVLFPQGLLVIGRSQRVNLALPGHPTPWLLNETRAGFHEGTVAILRDPYSRAGPEAVIGVPGAMGPSPAVSTSYMAGQRRVDKVIIPGYITSGRSTYQSPRRSSGRSIAAGSTCQVSHAPHSGTLHAGLPGTRAPACCLESFITRIFHTLPGHAFHTD